MKKVIFILPSHTGGGAEHVTMNVINQLDYSAFEVTLILIHSKDIPKDLINSKFKIITLNRSTTLKSFFSLLKIIKKVKPDLIFSSLFRLNIILASILLLIPSKAKLILRSPNSPSLLIKNNQMSYIMKKLISFSYNKANVVIAQTPDMAEEIIKYHDVDKKKVKFILNPIDENKIVDSLKENLSPFKKNKINIVASGRLTHQKGFDILLDGFKLVTLKNSNFHLHILGDGEDKNKLISSTSNLNLDEFVTFHGYIDNPYPYYKYSDLYVLSSRWEGLPNTVLENIYLNKPIVTTNCIPILSRLVGHGNNGYVVNIDNKNELAEAILNFDKLIMDSKSTLNLKSEFDTCFKQVIKGMI